MGATTDKIKGATNEAIGKAKQGIGEATGSDRLQGEGVIQEVKGKGQKAVGDAKDATKDAVNKAAAAANKNSLIVATRLVRMERPVPLGAGLFMPMQVPLVMAGLVPAIHVLPGAQHRRGCPGRPARRRASRFCPGHDADRYSYQRRLSITAGLTTLIGVPAA